MFDPDRRHLIAYVAAAAVLVVMALRLVGGGRDAAPPVSIAAPPPAPAAAAGRAREPGRGERPARIWVDVAGAVRRPGLYSLPKDARVALALQRAGGVGRGADQAAVNLAAKLVDGQQVFVPARGPGGRSGARAAAAAPGAVAAPGAGAAAAGGGQVVSLSTASQAELETLTGIGPALAARIVEYREQNGGFRSVEQLREVSGIGDKRLAALKDSIVP